MSRRKPDDRGGPRHELGEERIVRGLRLRVDRASRCVAPVSGSRTERPPGSADAPRSGSNRSEPEREKISGRVVIARTDLKPRPKRPISTPVLLLRCDESSAPTPATESGRPSFAQYSASSVSTTCTRPADSTARPRRSGRVRRAGAVRSRPSTAARSRFACSSTVARRLAIRGERLSRVLLDGLRDLRVVPAPRPLCSCSTAYAVVRVRAPAR